MGFGVVIYERQILSLGCGVGAFHVVIVDLHGLLVNGSVGVVCSLGVLCSSNHSGTVLIVDRVMASVEIDLLQPRINRLALQRQHPENAFMNAAQRFLADESLQRLDAQRKLTDGERPFSRKPS